MELQMTGSKLKIIKCEAWIDAWKRQPHAPVYFHVTAELKAGGKRVILKKIKSPHASTISLEIKQSSSPAYIPDPRHLSYAESIKNADHYSSLEIYFEGKKIWGVDEIMIIE